MAALLVALAVMAVLMSVALPVWRHEAQREKEEELIFRGQQYVRAHPPVSAPHPAGAPSESSTCSSRATSCARNTRIPSPDEDFELIGADRGCRCAGADRPGGWPGPASRSRSSQSGSSFGGAVAGGILGVRSKSKEESIRLYQGRNHYNEWTFVFVSQQPQGPGGGPGGQRGGPGGQRGGPGGQRGGPGGGPGGGFPGGGPGGGFPGGGPGGGFPGPGGPGRSTFPGLERPAVRTGASCRCPAAVVSAAGAASSGIAS